MNDNYLYYLEESLKIISKYLIIVKKNSLYFNDEISKLLSDYISLCSDATHSASDKIKDISDEEMKKKFSKISLEVYNKATARDKLLDKIKIKFKKELGNV